MTGLKIVAAAVTLYLLILARNAWRQGEMNQFLFSLAVVIGVIATVAAVVGGYIMFFHV